MRTLIKLYTPFICAITSLVNEILIYNNIRTDFLHVSYNLTGDSVLLLLYVYYHSGKMCKWYKLTIICLIINHIVKLMYRFDYIKSLSFALEIAILISVVSIMSWLLFAKGYKVCKTINSAGKHLPKE